MSAVSDEGRADVSETATTTTQNDCSPGSTAPTPATPAATSLPCHHQPQQQQHQQPDDTSLDPIHPQQGIIDFIHQTCRILWNYPGLVLNQESIDAARVEVTDLDFDNGKPCGEGGGGGGGDGEQFINVLPLEVIEPLLEQLQPWVFHDVEPRDDSLCQWWTAFYNLAALECWLYYTRFDKEGGGGGEDEDEDNRPLPLSKAVPRWKGSRTDGYYVRWRYLLDPDSIAGRASIVAQWSDRCRYLCNDESKPHVICLMASGNTLPYLPEHDLKDEELTTGEIWSILNHALTRMKLENQTHRVIPVTVISCIGRQGRVVQGFVGKRPGSSGGGDKYVLKVRKTKLVSLFILEEDKANFMRMLGWLVGEPVGNTD